MKILLDYVFPITVSQPIPAASTAFLKQVCVVAKPKSGQEDKVGSITLCTNMGEVKELTDNEDIQHLFDAGMTRVYVLLADDLNLAEALENKSDFFTVLVSSDFGDEDIEETVITPEEKSSSKIGNITYTSKLDGTEGDLISIEYLDTNTDGDASVTVEDRNIKVSIESGTTPASVILSAIHSSEEASALVTGMIDSGESGTAQVSTIGPVSLTGGVDEVRSSGLVIGGFKGVVGVSSTSLDVAKAQAKIENRAAFKSYSSTSFANMFFAFGKLLSNLSNWTNLQYQAMPVNDLILDLGTVNLLFDERVSFVLSDDEFGNRLGFFVAGGRAIAAPYIIKNLMIDMQSRTLQWIAENEPQYTLKEAALLETRVNEDVIHKYIDRGWLESGSIFITLREQNFVANGEIVVPDPKALWRVFGELKQSI